MRSLKSNSKQNVGNGRRTTAVGKFSSSNKTMGIICLHESLRESPIKENTFRFKLKKRRKWRVFPNEINIKSSYYNLNIQPEVKCNVKPWLS